MDQRISDNPFFQFCAKQLKSKNILTNALLHKNRKFALPQAWWKIFSKRGPDRDSRGFGRRFLNLWFIVESELSSDNAMSILALDFVDSLDFDPLIQSCIPPTSR